MQRCKNCLLPAVVPGADLDQSGTCAFCRAYRPAHDHDHQARRQKWAADLEDAIQAARGSGPYDALVCLSGGKDSIYLLYKLKLEYRLNVLAFTTDVSIPTVAWSSIRRTVAKLGVDHLVYRPADEFYRRLFRFLLENQEERGAVYTVSYVYAPLFEGDALAVATERGIPLIFAGYSPGQPDPARMEYEFSRQLICQTDWTPPALHKAKTFTQSDLARFWNPKRYPGGSRFPRYLAPFHAWDYDQDQTMRRVFELGLVAKPAHASPVHSNYPINWLLMYSDLRHFGYNPYAPEFAALIRFGKANRVYWRFMAPFVDLMIRRKLLLGRNTSKQMRWLDLKADDLKITMPRGAYDPANT
jgi:hypothetical protein